jgi:hypothetical protein
LILQKFATNINRSFKNQKIRMKKFLIVLLLVVTKLFNADVSKSAIDSTTLNSSIVNGNLTLNSSTTYVMKGFNYVRNNATLTIQPGTVILGDFETKGTLIIERGSKIYANGTQSNPIIFTSEKPQGVRNTGDWGGVIVLGRSSINSASGADSAEIEGFGPGLGPIYGGQPVVNEDSSGVLRYVRIEFPGVNLTGISGNEINGLTMGGVGSKTVIEHVQVSYSGDDSFEWFGGNVNCKYLIAYKGLDDDFDCDNGFRGKIQFGLSVRDKDLADVSSSNGFEIDNNNNSPSNFNSPRTRPIFSNMTVVGPFETTSTTVNPLFQRGAHLRRNMLACIYNSIVMGWRVGVRFDGSGVYNASTGDSIQIRNTIFAGNLKLADTAGSTTFNANTWLQSGAYSNNLYPTNSAVGLTSPYAIYPDPSGSNVSNWVPTGSSPALSGASFSNPNLAGFETVNFRGAFGSTNWSQGWSQFDPKNYVIPVSIRPIEGIVPVDFVLAQNYPNPFNPSTKIRFETPENGNVKLSIYDISGKELAVLFNGRMNSGAYEYQWNAADFPSGVYFYKLETAGFSKTMKMTLLK